MDVNNGAALGANQQPTGSGDNAPQFVTSEQLKAFEDGLLSKITNQIKSDAGRIAPIQAKVDQLMSMIGSGEPKKDAGAVDPKAEVEKILREEREKLNAEKSAVTKQRIRSTLENALLENGARQEAIKLAADSLMMRNADKIKINNNDLGESQVLYQDSEYAEAISVNDFVKNFLKGSEGQAILAPKKSPSTVGIPNGKGPVEGGLIEMTRMQAATADPKLLLSGRVVFVD